MPWIRTPPRRFSNQIPPAPHPTKEAALPAMLGEARTWPKVPPDMKQRKAANPAEWTGGPSDWREHPLPEKHITVGLDRPFSTEEMASIRLGSIPRQMEDKWFLHFRDDQLFFLRSWTGLCVYVARFQSTGDGALLVSADINRDPEQYTETDAGFDARMVLYLIDTLLLGIYPAIRTTPSSSGAWSDASCSASAPNPLTGNPILWRGTTKYATAPRYSCRERRGRSLRIVEPHCPPGDSRLRAPPHLRAISPLRELDSPRPSAVDALPGHPGRSGARRSARRCVPRSGEHPAPVKRPADDSGSHDTELRSAVSAPSR